MTTTITLIQFDAARRALAEARSIDEIKNVRDKAEALRLYVKQQGDGLEMQNDIAEIKIRAERRAGELLAERELAKGGRPSKNETGSTLEPVSLPTLADIGINKQQSHRWQRTAHIPEETFEQHIAKVKADGKKELTSTGMQRLAKKLEHQERAQNDIESSTKTTPDNGTIIIGDAREMDLSQFPHRYQAIIADPPWRYRVAKGQGITEDQYSTMTVEEISDMPIENLTTDDCVLFLWGTWPKLPEALQVMWAWGFEYVTGLPWIKFKGDKPFYGVGYWVRGCSEYILIGRKGKVSPPRLNGFLGLLSPSLKHSRKPDSVHEIAEALRGPYLELFARRSRPGWTVFGNEIQEMCL